MAGLGAFDQGSATQRQSTATQPEPNGVGDLLASPERREIAVSSFGVRPLVDRNSTFHSLGEARCVGGALRAGEGPGSSLGHGLSRRHEHPGTAQGGRSRQKGGFRKSRRNCQALCRPCGCFGSKVCVAADGRGKALSFTLTPWQTHELPSAMALMDALPAAPRYAACDREYASNRLREDLWSRGSRPVIPTKRNEPPVSCPKWTYRHRHLVEDLWARLKEWRTIATRYEKSAASFFSVICIAATAEYIKKRALAPSGSVLRSAAVFPYTAGLLLISFPKIARLLNHPVMVPLPGWIRFIQL